MEYFLYWFTQISDFGMSRDLADEDHYLSNGGKIPVRWTAPEAIKFRVYSTASDVWSYGCVLYEIWGMGSEPFETRENPEVFITKFPQCIAVNKGSHAMHIHAGHTVAWISVHSIWYGCIMLTLLYADTAVAGVGLSFTSTH